MSKHLNLAALNADGASVEVTFTTGNGQVVKGSIENSFFEEFAPTPTHTLSPARRARIVQDNADWLANEAERQLRMGAQHVVIS